MSAIGGLSGNNWQGYGGTTRPLKAKGTFPLVGSETNERVKESGQKEADGLSEKVKNYLRQKYEYSDLSFKFRQETLTDEFMKDLWEQGAISQECYEAYAKPAWTPYNENNTACNYRDPNITYQKFQTYYTYDEEGNATEHYTYAISYRPDYEYARIEDDGLPLGVSLERLMIQIKYAAGAEDAGPVRDRYLKQAELIKELQTVVEDIYK